MLLIYFILLITINAKCYTFCPPIHRYTLIQNFTTTLNATCESTLDPVIGFPVFPTTDTTTDTTTTDTTTSSTSTDTSTTYSSTKTITVTVDEESCCEECEKTLPTTSEELV